MTSPTVSLVIPCYNQAGYLREAIESARASGVSTQIVVVDDGSDDDTSEIARRAGGVTCVRQDNRGLAAARNRGLQEATGTLVIFLDADDRLLPGGIAAGVAALAERPHCVMAYGRAVMMARDGAFLPTAEPPVVPSEHYRAFLRTNPIWMPAMAIFRRDWVVRAGGFAAGFDGAADYDLYLRTARDRPIHDHGRLVAAYRQHPDSMSRNAERMLRETLAVMNRNRPDHGVELLDAWRDGYRGWQDFYGTHLVEEIRRQLRQGGHSVATRKALTLARLAPTILRRELARKTRVALSLTQMQG
jgi:glycosyltransferase involved in cell wall biosynthesis